MSQPDLQQMVNEHHPKTGSTYRPAHPDETGRQWTFDLVGLTRPPLSLNERLHRMEEHRITKRVKALATAGAQRAGLPRGLERISVELHYRPRDARRRDADNLVPTQKPCADALVTLGIVPDDTERWVLPTMPVIDAPSRGEPGLLYVVIRELRTHPDHTTQGSTR